MGFEISGQNNIAKANFVGNASSINNEKLLDCVLNNKTIIPNKGFTAEEQHTLGILANKQDLILIEE